MSPQGYGGAFKQVNAFFGVEKIDQMTAEQVHTAMAGVKARIQEAHAKQAQQQELLALPTPKPNPEDDADVRRALRYCADADLHVDRLQRAMEPIYNGLREIENRTSWPWPATCTQLLYLQDALFDQIGANLSALRRMCKVIRVAAIEALAVVERGTVNYDTANRA